MDTSLLETNVANGVAGLNASSEIATSLLETNVANGVAGLDASSEIAMAQLKTDVANGIPSLDANADLNLKGFNVTYNEARVALGGSFDVGQEVVCIRIGNLVTITSVGVLSFNITTNIPISGAGAIPISFRPSSDQFKMYEVDVSAGLDRRVSVNTSGDLELFLDSSALNAGRAFSITYVVEADIT